MTERRTARVLKRMSAGTMGGESRVATAAGYGRRARAISATPGKCSECVGNPVSVTADDGLFMGESHTMIYQQSIDGIYLYTFPSLSYISDVVSDIATLVAFFPAPYNDPATTFFTSPCAVVGPDGSIYAIIYDNSLGYTAVIRIESDGSSASLLHEFGQQTGNADGRITWHPASPGVLWVQLQQNDPGFSYTHGLFKVDIATGNATLIIDLSGVPYVQYWGNINQYESGIVFETGSASAGGRIYAYDVLSDTHDSISAPNHRGLYATNSTIQWRTFSSPAPLQIYISTSGSVSLSSTTPQCPELRSYFDLPIIEESFTYANAQEWLSPLDRSTVYISDTSNIWPLTCR